MESQPQNPEFRFILKIFTHEMPVQESPEKIYLHPLGLKDLF